MSDIFISYKREERAVAALLAVALEAQGLTVWWDPKVRGGEHFDDVIEEAIRCAKCVIVLWSTRSIKSRYVKDEATCALKLHKLVPVAIEAIEEASLPHRFGTMHTIDFQGWTGSVLTPAFKQLVSDLQSRFGLTAAPSTTLLPSTWSELVQRDRARMRAARTSTKRQPSTWGEILTDDSLSKGEAHSLMIKTLVNAMDRDILNQRAYLSTILDNPELLRTETAKLERMLTKRASFGDMSEN
jgi:hypothetical protein